MERTNHNTNKSLSIFKVEFDTRITHQHMEDMEVLSTYVTHQCDNKEPNTQLVGYTTIDVMIIVHDNQP
jgi:hypothetical protein